MIFVYKKWNNFCKMLNDNGIRSITAEDVLKKGEDRYIILKHDVEADVYRAYRFAKIESKYGHRGSFYVQAYLLRNKKNIHILKEIQKLGHEVSYHYDVLDACKGNIDLAINEFALNISLFKNNGFNVTTVCQHGNPIIERKGYTSNRDFFRNTKVQYLYKDIADIMVDFKLKSGTDFKYFSDAGRKFKLIYDPINNDVVNTEHMNKEIKSLNDIYNYFHDNNCIISVHPHRWTNSTILFLMKSYIFYVLRIIAKLLNRIPIMRKVMSKYYFLAKRL